MNQEALMTISKANYLALAEQKYNDLIALNDKPVFYDHEKSFEEICGAARADGFRSAGLRKKSQSGTDRPT